MAGRDYAYDGVLGGKTGYTDAAGATLITYAKRGNMTLVAVVMNSVNGAWADTKSLLDYGFDNFECKKVKIRKNPVPKKNLPGEQYLLNNCGNTYPFYYTKNVIRDRPHRNRPQCSYQETGHSFQRCGTIEIKEQVLFQWSDGWMGNAV